MILSSTSWCLRICMSAILAMSSFLPLANASKNVEMRKIKTQEFIKALKEGAEGENAAQYYHRMSPYIPVEVRVKIEPFLKNKGHFIIPKITSEGNVVTFSDSNQTIKMQIDHSEEENIVTVDGYRFTKKDYATPEAFFERIDKIIAENAKRAAKKSSGLHTLFAPPANAFFEANKGMWMGLALGVLGGALFGKGDMMTMLLFGLGGALLGSIMGKEKKPDCPGVRQCTNGSAGSCVTSSQDQCCAAAGLMDGCTQNTSSDYSRAPVPVSTTARDLGTHLQNRRLQDAEQRKPASETKKPGTNR